MNPEEPDILVACTNCGVTATVGLPQPDDLDAWPDLQCPFTEECDGLVVPVAGPRRHRLLAWMRPHAGHGRSL